ncbi:MAG: hypothetical protein LUH07_01930, partial [Lachnospiraceae bacterium]|nr:hypothetical protein [Lachnospiraceae bacterium]
IPLYNTLGIMVLAYVFGRITFPMISKGIATGWMMIFIISFRELVTASFVLITTTALLVMNALTGKGKHCTVKKLDLQVLF